MNSVRLIPKVYSLEEKRKLEGDGTLHLRQHKDLYSTVHIFSGYQYTFHSYLQVGELCPDEILELSLDEGATFDQDQFMQYKESGILTSDPAPETKRTTNLPTE